jgi:cell division septal protein FtsQ
MSGNRKNKRKEKFWYGSGKFFIVVILIYLAFYTYNKIADINAQRSDMYHKSDIQISGNRLVSTKQILDICGFKTTKDQEIKIANDSLASRLMTLKYIKGISITRRPPRMLNITVEEYEPVAFIYGKGLNLIDSEGYLIPVPDNTILWDLPIISGIKESLGNLGKKSKVADVYLALEIVRYLEDENPLLANLVSEINIVNKKSIELYLIKGGTKIRISQESFYKELFVLKNYIANYLDWVEMAKIDYIDLRFENQLIVKTKT